MAKEDNFIFPRSFRDALQYVPKVVRMEVYDAIIEYVFEGTIPKLDGIGRGFFTSFKQAIDDDRPLVEH